MISSIVSDPLKYPSSSSKKNDFNVSHNHSKNHLSSSSHSVSLSKGSPISITSSSSAVFPFPSPISPVSVISVQDKTLSSS
jgi:hypothetical protein